jgi:hypothetical protein
VPCTAHQTRRAEATAVEQLQYAHLQLQFAVSCLLVQTTNYAPGGGGAKYLVGEGKHRLVAAFLIPTACVHVLVYFFYSTYALASPPTADVAVFGGRHLLIQVKPKQSVQDERGGPPHNPQQ